MKYELSLKPGYCEKQWGPWEIHREFRNNAVDQGAYEILTEGKDVLFINHNARIKPSDLCYGGGREITSDTLARFHDGLKMSLAASLRLGIKIIIQNQDEIWMPCLHMSKKFQTEVVAIVTKLAPNPNKDVVIRLKGEAEHWKEFQSRFIDTPTGSYYGDLLSEPEMKGKVYVKGVFVQTDDSLAYGYNFGDCITLNRDRSLVDGWSLRFYAAKILASADSLDLQKVLCCGGSETEQIPGHLSNEQKTKLADDFVAAHGTKALAVTTDEEAKQLQYFGCKGIVLQKPLVNVIQSILGDIDSFKRASLDKVIQVVPMSDMSPDELKEYDVLRNLFEDYSPFEVATFGSDDMLGKWKGGLVYLARKLLSDRTEAISTLCHEYAHDHADDGTATHSHRALHIAATLAVKLLN